MFWLLLVLTLWNVTVQLACPLADWGCFTLSGFTPLSPLRIPDFNLLPNEQLGKEVCFPTQKCFNWCLPACQSLLGLCSESHCPWTCLEVRFSWSPKVSGLTLTSSILSWFVQSERWGSRSFFCIRVYGFLQHCLVNCLSSGVHFFFFFTRGKSSSCVGLCLGPIFDSTDEGLFCSRAVLSLWLWLC